MLDENVYRTNDDNMLLNFVSPAISTICLRILRDIVDNHADRLKRDLLHVKQFAPMLIRALIRTVKASMDCILLYPDTNNLKHSIDQLREHSFLVLHAFAFLMEQGSLNDGDMYTLHEYVPKLNSFRILGPCVHIAICLSN